MREMNFFLECENSRDSGGALAYMGKELMLPNFLKMYRNFILSRIFILLKLLKRISVISLAVLYLERACL